MLHPELSRPGAGYAYGFAVDSLPWGEAYGHGGGGKAFTANMRIGSDGHIIIVLANRRIWLKPMFDKIFAVLHGERPDPIRRTADLFLVKEIEKQGAEAICAELNRFLESHGYPAPKSPSDLLRASDMLGRIELQAEAILMAETIAQVFLLDNAYAWANLGELCFQQKDENKAAMYFQKALELDPEDSFARMRLEALNRTGR